MTFTSLTDDILKPLLKQKENILLEQLSDLLKAGVLVIEETQPVMVVDVENNLKISQSVKLTMRDKELFDTLMGIAEDAEVLVDLYDGLAPMCHVADEWQKLHSRVLAWRRKF